MFDIKDELLKLPDRPGVYLMKDNSGNVIYVGKAKILKNRVRSYFINSAGHSAKTRALVERIVEFETIVTDTEQEAFILECTLIKKYNPRFNILLKDDKSYPYIKITANEAYPRMLKVRKVDNDGAKYFGPYSNVGSLNHTMEIIRKLFPLKTCNKVLPRDAGKERPCLNYHINNCLAPCVPDKVSQIEYTQMIDDICNILNGKVLDVISKYTEKMQALSAELRFEEAVVYRNRIDSLRVVTEKQKIINVDAGDIDVFAFVRNECDICMQFFQVRNGRIYGRETYMLSSNAEAEDAVIMSDFLSQFYLEQSYIPLDVIINVDILDEEKIALEQFIASKREGSVHVHCPQRGYKRELIQMALDNASLELKRFTDQILKEKKENEAVLTVLKDFLHLKHLPHYIEAYDISNDGSEIKVGSKIVMVGGSPAKKGYRRYKIKTVHQTDDYACMREIVGRRLSHLSKENYFTSEQVVADNISPGDEVLPDILFIDGGVGHINTVAEVVADFSDYFGINIPIVGMAKDDKHRSYALVNLQGEELVLNTNIHLLRFVTAIQDEAHDFAIKYTNKLRSKKNKSSVLDNIDGVGPSRKKKLFNHFGTIDKMRDATIDDFTGVGIPENVARNIYLYLRKWDR